MRIAPTDDRLFCNLDIRNGDRLGISQRMYLRHALVGNGVHEPGLPSRQTPDILDNPISKNLSGLCRVLRGVLRVERTDVRLDEVRNQHVLSYDVERADLPERLAVVADLSLIVAYVQHPD